MLDALSKDTLSLATVAVHIDGWVGGWVDWWEGGLGKNYWIFAYTKKCCHWYFWVTFMARSMGGCLCMDEWREGGKSVRTDGWMCSWCMDRWRERGMHWCICSWIVVFTDKWCMYGLKDVYSFGWIERGVYVCMQLQMDGCVDTVCMDGSIYIDVCIYGWEDA